MMSCEDPLQADDAAWCHTQAEQLRLGSGWTLACGCLIYLVGCRTKLLIMQAQADMHCCCTEVLLYAPSRSRFGQACPRTDASCSLLGLVAAVTSFIWVLSLHWQLAR